MHRILRQQGNQAAKLSKVFGSLRKMKGIQLSMQIVAVSYHRCNKNHLLHPTTSCFELPNCTTLKVGNADFSTITSLENIKIRIFDGTIGTIEFDKKERSFNMEAPGDYRSFPIEAKP